MKRIEFTTSTMGCKRIFIDGRDCTPDGVWPDTKDLLIQALINQGIDVTHTDVRGRTTNMEVRPKPLRVPSPSGENARDMLGQSCDCGRGGVYDETSAHDDWRGVLHCVKCGAETPRYVP